MKIRTAQAKSSAQIVPFVLKNERRLIWRLFPGIILLIVILLVVLVIYRRNYTPVAKGRIFAEKYEIGAYRDASIDKINVKLDDFVSKNDVLVKLNTDLLRSDIKQIEEEMAVTEQEMFSEEAKLKLQQSELRLKQEDSLFMRMIEIYNAESALNYSLSTLGSVRADLMGAKLEIERHSKLLSVGGSSRKLLAKEKTRHNTDSEIIKHYEKIIKANESRLEQAQKRYSGYALKQENIQVPIKEMILPLKNKINILKTEKEKIKTLIEQSYLKAPVNGRITDVFKRENSCISSGETILAIQKFNKKTVEAYVEEKWASKVYIGEEVVLYPVFDKNSAVRGKVSHISSTFTYIPQDYTDADENFEKHRGIRFTVSLDNSWDGPCGASFDIRL